jgi:hypothetical protein
MDVDARGTADRGPRPRQWSEGPGGRPTADGTTPSAVCRLPSYFGPAARPR